jgi:hypothetical protein
MPWTREDCVEQCHNRYEGRMLYGRNNFRNAYDPQWAELKREAQAELDRCLAGCVAYPFRRSSDRN